jgi:phosphopantothenoylcysteine decarboxylase/phosphopantothenate--cysteine ligase
MPDIRGKRVLITAGPTYEAIDPVRFIGNHSSGKMGIAIADALTNEGASVMLVCGPSSVQSSKKVNRVNVTSAQNMFDEVMKRFTDCDILILAAAVADYRPKKVASEKIKKKDAAMTIELEPTPDILATLGERKSEDQLLVGFALETENELENAKQKLTRKNCDILILNSLQNKGAGFGHDTNQITIIDKRNNISNFELKSKQAVAQDILKAIKTY